MYLFLISFLTLYGGMHLYAFLRLRDAFQPRPLLTWLLISWMIVMTIAPLLVRFSEQLGRERTALIIAWPGYLWMGFLFIFTSTQLFTEVICFSYRFVYQLFSLRALEYVSSYNTCVFALVLAMSASIYAYIEAGRIRSEHIVITSSKLPYSTTRIRIVQVSDVHIGLLLHEARLQRIMKIAKDARPDILVSTGDLVDGKLNRNDDISGLNPLAALFASVPAPSGKFAVTGNHEVYAGLPQAVAFSQAAGFTMLRNQSVTLQNGITISGVDDPAVTSKALAAHETEAALLHSASHNSFHLLLKHRPEILPGSDGNFDLQLSGHVHGGQIFPFNFLVRLTHPIPCGTTTTKAGSLIYVSRGAGTWGPPMRLLAPPEVTIIDVIPQPQNILPQKRS